MAWCSHRQALVGGRAAAGCGCRACAVSVDGSVAAGVCKAMQRHPCDARGGGTQKPAPLRQPPCLQVPRPAHHSSISCPRAGMRHVGVAGALLECSGSTAAKCIVAVLVFQAAAQEDARMVRDVVASIVVQGGLQEHRPRLSLQAGWRDGRRFLQASRGPAVGGASAAGRPQHPIICGAAAPVARPVGDTACTGAA